MPSNNNINFQINYQKGDTSALDSLKKELQELKGLASNLDLGLSPDEINKLLPAVSALERAMNGAFDINLNTVNIQKFNQLLSQSGMNIKTIQQGLSVAGAAGDKAFLDMTAQLMQFNNAVKQTNKFLDNIANSFFNTLKYTAFNAAINSITGTIQKSFYYVKDLDKSLNDIRIVTGKSADEMSRFAEEANEAAKQLAVTTSDYTEGSLIYYQQGLDDETVKTLTDITAMTSNVTGQSMNEVSEQLTAVWNGYRVANQAAQEGMDVYQEYVDKMAAVGAATASDLEELSVAMSKVASAASSMGISFDDLNAQIATIVSVTRQAPESVGTALKTIYARLGDLSVDGVDEFGVSLGKVTQQMQVMGIEILDQNGNMRDMSSVMAEVAQKWNTWTDAQKQAAAVAMAGKRQYNNLVALFDNWDMYGEALETSMNAAGTLEKQQEIALDSLANKMDILKATAEDLYDSLINEDTLKNGIEGLTKIVQLLADFADATGGLNNLIPILGASLARVFNKQLTNGISAIVVNMNTAAEKARVDAANQAELNKMLSDSNLMTPQTGTASEAARIEGSERLKNIYQDIVQYKSVMNEQDQQQYKMVLNLAQKAGKLGIEVANQKENWMKITNSLGIIDNKYMANMTDYSTELAEEISKVKTDADDILRSTSNIFKQTFKGKNIDKQKDNAVRNFLSDESNFPSGNGSKYLEIYNSLTGTAEQKTQQLVNKLKELGMSAENIQKLENEMRTAANDADNLGSHLSQALDTKALVSNITETVASVGQLVFAFNSLINIADIWNDEEATTSEKLSKLLMTIGMNAPMILSSIKSISASTKALSASIIGGLTPALTGEAAAAGAATTATEGFTVALATNPIGAIILALTTLVGVFMVVEKHQEKIRENAQKQAEESRKAATELRNEANAHKELISNYDEVLDRYKQGSATKEELYEATDKLIDAYDLEAARLDVLLGKYESVTDAIQSKRNAELEEEKSSNKTAIEDTLDSFTINKDKEKRLYKDDVGKSLYAVTTIDSSSYKDFAEKQKILNQEDKLLGKYKTDSSDDFNFEFEIDTTNAAEVLDFYNKLIEYQRWLRDNGYKDTEFQKQISGIISSLTKDNDLENLEELRDAQKDIILEQAELSDITSEKGFQSAINDIKTELSSLYSEDEIDSIIKNVVSHINTSTAKQFYIDNLVKEKLGHEMDDALKAAFHRYDPKTQEVIIGLGWDFDEDSLNEFATMAQTQVRSSYRVPVSFQSQINEIVLKGKDINKADWETYTENLPTEAAQLLGEREEFNNKTIGQRITLLEKVNELILQENNLAAQSGLKYEKSKEKVLEQLDQQEQKLKEQAIAQQNIIDDADATEEEWNNAEIELERIQAKLIELDKEKYNIEIGIDLSDNVTNQVNSMLSTVLTDSDKLRAAAESIGAGWQVAAENVGTFAAAFPDLMEKATVQTDGSLQLDAEYTNQYLENIQARIKANKQEAIAAAETQLQKVQLELKYTDAQLDLIQSALDGKKTKTEVEEGLEKNALDYSLQMEEAGLLGEKEALEQAQQNLATAAEGMKGSFENINEYIKTTNENYAQMFSENPNWKGLAEVKEGVKSLAYDDLTAAKQKALDANGIDEEYYQKLLNEQDYLLKQKESLEAQQTDLINNISLTSASLENANKAAERVKKGLAGKEDKSKSSGKDKDKELKKLEEEFDRYWEIHKALDLIDRDLKKLDKDQEKLYGRELIRSLKQENELLANQAQLYEQLAAAQQQEAEELRGKLAASGVVFDTSGAVVNYAQATAEALKKYNDAVQAYNAGLLDDAAFKIHEKAFEEFKKNLERYDTLFYNEMKETQDKLDEIRRKTLENNLKAWEVEIQLKLDFKQLERDWNDFIKEVTSDFKKVFKDLRVEVRNMVKDAQTYIGSEGTLGTIIGAVHNVTGEIDKMMGGGSSDMFESVSQAQEKLKELNEQLLDSSKALHDLWTEAWDNYLDGIDQVNDKFDDLLDRYEKIDEELEFQQKLIELLYGDEAYQLMSKLYEGQEKNISAQVQSVKQQVDMWKQLFEASGASMDNQLNWEEDQKKYYENWMSAQSQLNDLVIEYIELLKKDYLNTVSDILKQLETFITGSSLNNIDTQWERIKANAEKYYDSVEGAYHIQTLANKIDQSIADSNNLQAQQKLMKLREKEIDYLREKENLTEYDIKAAELRYQIALKEIALEDAQNNKNSMKLTRNEQGNWSYQYIADEQDIANKRQELLDTYNDLYQLASTAYESNLEALTELQEKYIESAKTIYEDENLSEEERQQKLLELREWYLEQYRLLSEENQLYRNDLATAGSALLLEIYRQDEEAYTAMTEKERELMDTLINTNIDDYMDMEEKLKENYQQLGDKAKEVMEETRLDWTSGAQTIADLWNKDSGWSVKTQVVKAYDAIQVANQKYKESVDWCAAAVERNFGEEGITGAIMRAEYETDNLRDRTIDLVNTSIPYLNELRSYVDQIGYAWRSVQQEIMNAINLINEYLRKVGDANAVAVQSASIGSGSGSTGVTPSSSGSPKKTSPSSPSKSYEAYSRYSDGTVIAIDQKGNYIRTLSEEEKKRIGMATGGYTGDWGDSSGRVAVLHQKELVLNADDTENFLSGIDTIRSLVSSNGTIEKAVLKAAANMAYSLGNITPGTIPSGVSNTSTTDNIFNITAEFPNANNVDDIRQAILSLPNVASQYINSNLK